MSKSFKQVLIDIVGRDLENKGFELASMKCHQGYPIYHRKSNRYIEIIQFGKDRYEPKLIISCSIVYLGVDEKNSNIHYPSFRELELSRYVQSEIPQNLRFEENALDLRSGA